MPTLEHNAIVDMFRERPELAPHLLTLLFQVDVPPHESVTVVESSLDQLIPVEFRADLVLEVRGANGARVLAIVVEVQREKDPDKVFSWPVYAAVVRARMRCPAIVLVVAPDEDVAKWAVQTVDLGAGLVSFRPVVLGPASDPEHAGVYSWVIWKGLRKRMRPALEALIMNVREEMEKDPEFNAFMSKVLAFRRERDAVEAAAKDAGAKEGRAHGTLLGLRDALFRLTTRAGIALTDEDRTRVEACEDVPTLEHWVENVLGAKTTADVFAG